MHKKPDIRSLSTEDLRKRLSEQNIPKYRANQIQDWLWKKGKKEFADMNNIPKLLRDQLSSEFSIHYAKIHDKQISSDGTIKVAIELHDNFLVESVLIPTSKRVTACISSQVGCSLSCAFCATGKMKRMRNLSPAEIYDQVVIVKELAKEYYNQNLTNIVFMGMGEPLLNYNNVQDAISWITCKEGLGMSPSRITVSTAGISKMIRMLGDEGIKYNLALSLHAANDIKRNEIMSINESNTLESLADAIKYYHEKTGN